MDKYASAKVAFDPSNLAVTLTALAGAIQAVRSGAGTIGSTPPGLASAARALATARRGIVIYDERVLEVPNSAAILTALRVLEKLVADLDDSSTGRLLALPRETNSRGAAEMGVPPTLLAGGRPIDDGTWFSTLSSAWGLPVSGARGLEAAGILGAAVDGELDGIYLLEADPLTEWPDETVARQALEKIPFLLVQTPLLTPSAQLADVVLPAAGFAEENGTLTNLEGRVQSLGQAVAIPGEARDGWEILSILSNRLGVTQTYDSAAVVTQEISDTLDLPAWRVLGRYPRRARAVVGGGV
jgi:predicted molibdopterin-dependent oxidoreductase YjgC